MSSVSTYLSTYGTLLYLTCWFTTYNGIGYDYTGYGASAIDNIRPTEKQSYIDIETVYQYLLDTGLVKDPSTQLVLYGIVQYLCIFYALAFFSNEIMYFMQ